MVSELVTYSIREIAELIEKKQVSPVELMESTLKNIKKKNSILNAFTLVDYENAITKAKQAEENLEACKSNVLHGIPIGIKDNINTKGMVTTYGSPIFKNNIPEKDAFVVEKLERAGAIIVGKHVTHQFAYGPTGDRSYQGASKNPHNINKMTGGSSGGSAASVSAYMNFAAIGTDTGGSIRIPSAFCGVVGIKPTFGTVSNRGVYPLVWSMDHVGPITRTVYDNALMLNVISDHDDRDYLSIKRKKEDFTRLIGKSIKDKVVAVPINFFLENLDEEIKINMEQVIKLLIYAGAKIRYITINHIERYLDSQRIIMRTRAYLNHENNLKEYPELWDEEVKERLLSGKNVSVKQYSQALEDRYHFSHELNRQFENTDIILTPTTPILPLNINDRNVGIGPSVKKRHVRDLITSFTAPINLIGFPSLSLPSGYSTSLMPIGIQLIGDRFSEARLYQFAHVIEQLSLTYN